MVSLVIVILLPQGCSGIHELGDTVVLVGQKLFELFDHGHEELAGGGLVIPFHFI